MKRLRCRSFTLLEILVSLSLASLLMGFALTTITRVVKWSLQSGPIKEEILNRGALEQHLMGLFSKIPFEDNKEPRFFTKLDSQGRQTLRFTIDHGIDADHDFSGLIQAEIFVDSLHTLKLVIYGKREKKRTETLMQDVEKIRFKFFYPAENKVLTELSEKQAQSPPMIFTLVMEMQSLDSHLHPIESYTFYPSYHIAKRGIPMYHLGRKEKG